MASRNGVVWTGGTGWVQKKATEEANYQNLGDGWIFMIAFMRAYPDFIQDLFRCSDADYDLSLIQRVIMRAKARNQYCDITGCRGLTKSYCSMNEEQDEMILYPRTSTAYFGPSYKQTAKIGSQTYKQIQKDYPGLAEHFKVDADSTDRFEISTQYGSKFTITAFRGANLHKVVAEETAQENLPKFDEEEYKTVVLPAVRLRYLVNGKQSPAYIPFKQHTITSAGRRQNHSYETRCRHFRMMSRGEKAFIMDVPYEVPLLCQMRPTSWAESLRTELTPDEWAREMESRYTGSDQNPVIPDSSLTESRQLLTMEEHHCCRDYDNSMKPEDIIYIIGYDVSYADGAENALCACTVLKCTPQKDWTKRDRYLKQVVWVYAWPPQTAMEQAAKIKRIWNRYCYEGYRAYIAIDAWQYGTAVVQALMMDLQDGLPPMKPINRTLFTEYELPGAVECIYPIKAGGVGTTDPDAEMIRYAEVQFDNHNVQLLTSNHAEGMEAYKRLHRIKDDRNDFAIYMPYKETNKLVGEIQNLKKVTASTGTGVSEKRISRKIQRDRWSSLKYALRLADVLEQKNLMKAASSNDWQDIIKSYDSEQNVEFEPIGRSRIVGSRKGGRKY